MSFLSEKTPEIFPIAAIIIVIKNPKVVRKKTICMLCLLLFYSNTFCDITRLINIVS